MPFLVRHIFSGLEPWLGALGVRVWGGVLHTKTARRILPRCGDPGRAELSGDFNPRPGAACGKLWKRSNAGAAPPAAPRPADGGTGNLRVQAKTEPLNSDQTDSGRLRKGQPSRPGLRNPPAKRTGQAGRNSDQVCGQTKGKAECGRPENAKKIERQKRDAERRRKPWRCQAKQRQFEGTNSRAVKAEYVFERSSRKRARVEREERRLSPEESAVTRSTYRGRCSHEFSPIDSEDDPRSLGRFWFGFLGGGIGRRPPR